MASTERELVKVFEVARKAAYAAEKSGDPADVERCVDAIRMLREVPVTVKILVDTQVGKKLRSHLTKHPLKRIQKAASDLCELWKRKVIEETSKKKGGHSSEKGHVMTEPSSADGSKIEKNEMNEKMKVDNLSKAENFKVEKTSLYQKSGTNGTIYKETVKIDKNTKEEKQPSKTSGKSSALNLPPKLTSMVKCNDAVRDKNRELFAEALSKVHTEAHEDVREEVEACDPIRTAVLLESVMFEKLGRSSGAHKQKYRSILFNLKDQNNPDLRRRVLLGEIKPQNLINMTAEDMASNQRKLQNQQIKEKALFECERGMQSKASTDQFKCGRCGQRKCTYYQMQTRSADEPMTTFVTCVNCDNHWKFC